MKGRQTAGPEWRALCAEVRAALLEVCPLSNRHFDNRPRTFRWTQVSALSGVSLHNLARLARHRLPGSPDTVTRLAEFLGLRLRLERFRPPPTPPASAPSEDYKYGERRRRKSG